MSTPLLNPSLFNSIIFLSNNHIFSIDVYAHEEVLNIEYDNCAYDVDNNNEDETWYMLSKNGSFILPNGIIVLVDEDIPLYLNNTLIFYNKDEELI